MELYLQAQAPETRQVFERGVVDAASRVAAGTPGDFRLPRRLDVLRVVDSQQSPSGAVLRRRNDLLPFAAGSRRWVAEARRWTNDPIIEIIRKWISHDFESGAEAGLFVNFF